jgi:hypothetical protein
MLGEQKWTMQLAKTTTFSKSKEFGSEEFIHLILNLFMIRATWQGEPMHWKHNIFCFGANKKVLECWEVGFTIASHNPMGNFG